MTSNNPPTYQSAGVDTEQADIALKRLVQQVRQTWPTGGGIGSVLLDVGYFANVIDLGGIGLAIAADGVGSKVIIAQMMQQYDTVGIDCVAMNVNDLICVGARPVSMVDYLALQEPHPDMLEAIGKGLRHGAEQAGISIAGGEVAQLRDIIKGQREGFGFDLAATAVGTVALDKIIIGQDIQPGDVLIGIESNGIHSNGLTLARRVFFEWNDHSVTSSLTPLDCTLGEELLKPTHIYVKEVLQLLDQNIPLKALMHITGDGFLNLTRVAAEVGYVIEDLPVTPAIFALLQELGKVSDEEMFRVYNMGIGFCIIVPDETAEQAISIIQSHGKQAYRIGYTVQDQERRITIKPRGLIGKDKRFFKQS
ncbi:MAG: phosphoribosylformylglycinamidine cyclo-ligase [bacterium]|nr:phosphoribosylformylglycinamidine cyclo-ligase [bacterium]